MRYAYVTTRHKNLQNHARDCSSQLALAPTPGDGEIRAFEHRAMARPSSLEKDINGEIDQPWIADSWRHENLKMPT